jgi:hypothetical protein
MPFMAKTLANGIAWYVRTPQDAEEQDHRLIVICSIFTVHKFLYFDTRERKRKNRHSNERTETKEHTICFFCKKNPQPLLFRSSSLAFPASCPRAARSKPPNRQVRHQISRASQEQEPSVPSGTSTSFSPGSCCPSASKQVSLHIPFRFSFPPPPVR